MLQSNPVNGVMVGTHCFNEGARLERAPSFDAFIIKKLPKSYVRQMQILGK